MLKEKDGKDVVERSDVRMRVRRLENELSQKVSFFSCKGGREEG